MLMLVVLLACLPSTSFVCLLACLPASSSSHSKARFSFFIVVVDFVVAVVGRLQKPELCECVCWLLLLFMEQSIRSHTHTHWLLIVRLPFGLRDGH